MFGLQHSNFLRTERNESHHSSVPRPCLLTEGRARKHPEGSQTTSPRGWAVCVQCHSQIVHIWVTQSSSIPWKFLPAKRQDVCTADKTRAVLLLQKLSGPKAKPSAHTPLSRAFPGMPASIAVRFLLAKHRKQKNRGFPRVTEKRLLWYHLLPSVQTQLLHHQLKLPLTMVKSSKPRREEKRPELQLLLRRLHIHSQSGSSKNRNFAKKAFYLGMAKTMTW